MSNEKHYFGAYLEIKAKKMKKIEYYRECKNGHLMKYGLFCSLCGEELNTKTKTVYGFPTLIYDHLLEDDKWKDTLSIITPQNLDNTGTIIAIDNDINSNSKWKYSETQIKPFPTQKEIIKMKDALANNCQSIIEILKKSNMVISVTVKAGYVLNQQY